MLFFLLTEDHTTSIGAKVLKTNSAAGLIAKYMSKNEHQHIVVWDSVSIGVGGAGWSVVQQMEKCWKEGSAV